MDDATCASCAHTSPPRRFICSLRARSHARVSPRRELTTPETPVVSVRPVTQAHTSRSRPAPPCAAWYWRTKSPPGPRVTTGCSAPALMKHARCLPRRGMDPRPLDCGPSSSDAWSRHLSLPDVPGLTPRSTRVLKLLHTSFCGTLFCLLTPTLPLLLIPPIADPATAFDHLFCRTGATHSPCPLPLEQRAVPFRSTTTHRCALFRRAPSELRFACPTPSM